MKLAEKAKIEEAEILHGDDCNCVMGHLISTIYQSVLVAIYATTNSFDFI